MAKKRNNIKVGLIRGNSVVTDTKPDMEKFNSLVEKGKKSIKPRKKGVIISRVDHPINLKYNGDTIRVSPRAKLNLADITLIEGDIPQGLFLKS